MKAGIVVGVQSLHRHRSKSDRHICHYRRHADPACEPTFSYSRGVVNFSNQIVKWEKGCYSFVNISKCLNYK